MHFSLFNYAEMLALLVSILCFKYIIRTVYWVLMPYMAMIVIAEITGKQLAMHKMYIENVRLFNITTVIEFIIFYYLFYQNLTGKTLKKIVTYIIPLYTLTAVINQAFIQGFSSFHTYTMLIGTVFLIMCVFFYFFEAFSTREPVHLFREPMFWIATGVFLFYLGDFTYNLMQPYIIKNNMRKEGAHLFNTINHNLIIFEYVCISIGIIVCARSNRSALKLQS